MGSAERRVRRSGVRRHSDALLRRLDVLRSGRITRTVRWTFGAALANTVAGVLSARLLAPSDRGLLAVSLSIAGLVAVFSSLGTNVVLRAEIFRAPAGLMRGYLRLSVLLNAGIFIPILMASLYTSALIVEPAFWEPTSVVTLLCYGTALFWWFQLQEAVAAIGSIQAVARTSALGSLALAIVLAALFPIADGSYATVMGAYTAGMIAQSATLAVLIASSGRISRSTPSYRFLLREGPKSLGYHFGQNLVFRLDRYLLSALSGSHQAGIYAVASTPAELIKTPITAVGQFTMFDMARGGLTYRSLWVKAAKATLAALVLAAVGAATAPFVIPVVYGDDYRQAIPIFQLLLVAQIALTPYLIFSRALAATTSRLLSSAVGVLGLVVLVSLSFSLAPSRGAAGVAIAAAASYGIMSVLSATSCRRAVMRSSRVGS